MGVFDFVLKGNAWSPLYSRPRWSLAGSLCCSQCSRSLRQTSWSLRARRDKKNRPLQVPLIREEVMLPCSGETNPRMWRDGES